jgi:hypothetical protein
MQPSPIYLQHLDDPSWEPAIHRGVIDCLVLFAEMTYDIKDTTYVIQDFSVALFRPLCEYILHCIARIGETGTVAALEQAVELLSALLRAKCCAGVLALLSSEYSAAAAAAAAEGPESQQVAPTIFALTFALGDAVPLVGSYFYRSFALFAFKRLERALSSPKYGAGVPEPLSHILRDCCQVGHFERSGALVYHQPTPSRLDFAGSIEGSDQRSDGRSTRAP